MQYRMQPSFDLFSQYRMQPSFILFSQKWVMFWNQKYYIIA